MTAASAARTGTPRDDLLPPLVLPRYGTATLVDLLPSMGAHLGVPGCRDDALGLPPAERYVVVLVDGLGWNLLRRFAREAPYLSSLLGGARPMACGVPSTTVTSLSSLGTGLTPGQHGMVGYSWRVPGTGEIVNALTWESALPPRDAQPEPTMLERAAAAGVAVSTVSLSRFEGSGLTEAALRGADFIGVDDDHSSDAWLDRAVQAAARGRRSLVYAYERHLDHTGHVQGCDSAAWIRQLVAVDRRLEALRERLPDDVALVVTGDHGMVDIPMTHRLLAEDEPALMAGVSALAGEGRFRQLYVDREPVAAVAARWTQRLGRRAWVRTREEAVQEGWFGSVSERNRPRYGDVLVAMRDDWAVMTRQVPREFTLVGMHGSLTPAEMLVPLLADS